MCVGTILYLVVVLVAEVAILTVLLILENDAVFDFAVLLIVVWKILQRSQEVLLGYIDHICGLGRSDRVLRRKLAEE